MLLGRLVAMQGLVLALLVVLLVFGLLLFLPESPARDQFLGLLLILGLGTGGGLFVLVRRQARLLEEPLRELIAAAERFENSEGRRGFAPASGTIDELADSFTRLQDRLAVRIQELEEDRQQLRAILSGMVEGVVALDFEQRVLFANERASKLLEVEMGRLVGRRLWEVVRQRPILDVVQRALSGHAVQQEEVYWNGNVERSLTVHAASLSGDPPRGAVIVLHDTSALRRLERLRQEFVANVSHELKTPLSVIKICVETLMDRGAIDDLQHRTHFLEQIAHQGDRLHALILDLLSLARIESGDQMLEFAAIPVRPMVEGCLEAHEMRATTKNQTLAHIAPEEDPGVEVWADEEALEQILNNLLDNAVKYTPEGGRIEVGWRRVGDTVELSVTDTGIGIPEADLPRIFERFYRVDKARSRELGGTGLGLSIVKHLAQALGGSIRATSEHGRGSCFVVTLPAAPRGR
jgi:two-component system phosphate regulon sensor histidine kinase PhoR